MPDTSVNQEWDEEKCRKNIDLLCVNCLLFIFLLLLPGSILRFLSSSLDFMLLILK
ncbi:MAG: hypothetical protein MHMPM18_004838 [Marteilia pararefringens]